MTLLRLLFGIAVVAAVIQYWHGRGEEKALRAMTSEAGFVPVPMPDGSVQNTVLVFAPINCPREGAQRARDMVQKLTDRGILSALTDHYGAQSFEPSPEKLAGYKRLNTVMTGELPIVLINGMGKSNPTVDEVVAEYRRTK